MRVVNNYTARTERKTNKLGTNETMFNITINCPPQTTNRKQQCFHIPSDTPLVHVKSFFKTLGFELRPVADRGQVFLDVINTTTKQSHAWILLSGKMREVH